jgi:hypothetical protein
MLSATEKLGRLTKHDALIINKGMECCSEIDCRISEGALCGKRRRGNLDVRHLSGRKILAKQGVSETLKASFLRCCVFGTIQGISCGCPVENAFGTFPGRFDLDSSNSNFLT